MSRIVIYTKVPCPYCDWAKQFLRSKNLNFEEIRVDLDHEKFLEMERLSHRRTVPQIFINDQSIGGYDDMMALHKSGELSQLLE